MNCSARSSGGVHDPPSQSMKSVVHTGSGQQALVLQPAKVPQRAGVEGLDLDLHAVLGGHPRVVAQLLQWVERVDGVGRVRRVRAGSTRRGS